MAKLVSKTYGEALFELAKEKHSENAMLEEVTALLEILKENPQLDILMNNPRISREERGMILKNIFEKQISSDLFSFLMILVDKNRYSEIENILSYFVERVREDQGIGTAYVVTATKLDALQKKQIEDKLLATTSYNRIDIKYSVDSSLIGGMTIRIKDRVVDSSIRSKLERMERDLHRIQLEQD